MLLKWLNVKRPYTDCFKVLCNQNKWNIRLEVIKRPTRFIDSFWRVPGHSNQIKASKLGMCLIKWYYTVCQRCHSST